MGNITIWGLWLLQLGPLPGGGHPTWDGGPGPFAGIGGPPHSGPWLGLPNALSTVLWGLLLLLVLSRFRSSDRTPARPLLAIGFGLGLVYESVLLAAELFHFRQLGWMMPRGMSFGLLILVGVLAKVFLIAGFVRYQSSDDAAAKRYVSLCGALVGLTALAIIVESATIALLGIPRLGPMTSSHVALALGLMTLILGAAFLGRTLHSSQRWLAMAAIGCFALGDAIRSIGLLPLFRISVLRPWSEFLHMPPPVSGVYATDAGIVGALLLGYLFVRMHSAAVRMDFRTLEEHVTERTADLKAAMEELAIANAKLVEQSTVDSLTGAGNRRFFDEALHKEWAIAAREARSLSVALIDIDCFKQINDRYGHQKGDECLVGVARHLQNGARRPADVLARFGGDEFVLLLPGVDLTGVEAVLESARLAIEAMGIESGLHLTISAGAAACVPSAEGSPEGLLQAADERLYVAKQAGRNRVNAGVVAVGEPPNAVIQMR